MNAKWGPNTDELYSHEHDMFTRKRCYPSLTFHTPHTLMVVASAVKYNFNIYNNLHEHIIKDRTIKRKILNISPP